MGTEEAAKSARSSAKTRELRLRAAAFALFGVVVFSYFQEVTIFDDDVSFWTPVADLLPQQQQAPAQELLTTDPFIELRNCTISFKPPPPKKVGEWKTKPIWFPAHPGTLEESLHKKLIAAITGLPAGGKSFYASAKASKLRQCFGNTETATCSNVHPIIDMGKKHPETRSDKFYPKYILGVRNPAATLPSYHNWKAIKYHGLCEGCQVPEEDWRKHRDEWHEDMVKTWSNFIAAWKHMQKYSVALYFVYEDLFDLMRGPDMLKRLASLLKDAGFSTAPEEDIECIWYNVLGKDNIKTDHERPYEYKDYIPGYTVKEREFMFEAINTLAEEFSEDSKLVDILRRYQEDIRTGVRIDVAWSNETSSSTTR